MNYQKAGEETHWQLEDGTCVTLTQVVEFLDKTAVSVSQIELSTIAHKLIKVERDAARVEAADLTFPIIISMHNEQYISILDGQHRIVKAINIGLNTISCRILDLDTCHEVFRKVFL
jgi:predicted HAD superfamily phosphohydrolase